MKRESPPFPREWEGGEVQCDEYVFSYRKVGATLILDFLSNDEEGGEWGEGEGWMQRLAAVRDGLLEGDARALYLGWLRFVQQEQPDEDTVEPPVPAGLGALPNALRNLVEFLEIDPDLVAGAAEASTAKPVHTAGLTDWIAALPESEKNRLLLEAAEAPDQPFGRKLLTRFHASAQAGDKSASADASASRRTVAELFEAAKRQGAVRASREAKARARECEKQAKERAKYLEGLEGRKAAV